MCFILDKEPPEKGQCIAIITHEKCKASKMEDIIILWLCRNYSTNTNLNLKLVEKDIGVNFNVSSETHVSFLQIHINYVSLSNICDS